MKPRTHFQIIAIVFAAVTVFVWYRVLTPPLRDSQIYFLDVGQGDATILFLNGVSVLTDAGPDKAVLSSIEKVPIRGKYIDLAIVTHPERDHFYGFIPLLDHYRVGTIIINGRGREDETEDVWEEFLAKARGKNIPIVVLKKGDAIRHKENKIEILSPDPLLLQSAALNDTGFVEYVTTPEFTALLSADIAANVESYISDALRHADILKVPHHGSKYSSSDEFLKMLDPAIAVIQVGKDNRYGHPTPEALGRLKTQGAHIFRTDLNGNIRVAEENGMMRVYVEKMD